MCAACWAQAAQKRTGFWRRDDGNESRRIRWSLALPFLGGLFKLLGVVSPIIALGVIGVIAVLALGVFLAML